MTKVTYLQGIPRRTAINEAPDRAAEVSLDNTNFAMLGNDRAAGALLLRQLKIFAEYYPDRKELVRGYQYARDYLSGKQRTPGGSDYERQVANELKKIKVKKVGVGSVESARNEFFETILEGGNIDLSYIYDLCREHNRGLINTSRGKCRDELIFLAESSDLIGKSGHHMLYEFSPASPPEAAVITKRILHKNGVGALANITKLSRDNMRRWMRVGIMEGHVKERIMPLQPEEAIVELRQGIAAGDVSSIAAIPAAVAIIGAVASALAAAAGIIDSISRSSLLQNNAQGFGQPDYGPQISDFPGGQNIPGGGTAGTGGNSNLMPILLGAGGLLLLTSK